MTTKLALQKAVREIIYTDNGVRVSTMKPQEIKMSRWMKKARVQCSKSSNPWYDLGWNWYEWGRKKRISISPIRKNDEVMGMSKYLSIIALNINDLYSPIKR